MKNRILGVLILLFVSIFSLVAQDAFRSDHRKSRNQHERMRDGFKQGDLTPRECGKLRHQQREFRFAKKMALRDGRISRCEKKELRRLKHRNDRNIYSERHDCERR